ncbi:hypothetical protein A2U01_0088385, partial [Trifolium medium]|nr:hypothetical protein [Trifolium medium]
LFAKLEVFSDVDLLTHASHPEGVRDLLRNDAQYGNLLPS